MTFDELLALACSNSALRVRIDSRLVRDGDIFAAIEGTAYDGHDFVDEAIGNGAKYIVYQRDKTSYGAAVRGREMVSVDNSAWAAGVLAQACRGNPASKLTNLAVTGTNGKTTVAFLVRAVIEKANQTCGLIGTIVYDTSCAAIEASLTTPDCLVIAEMTERMVEAGSEFMVIEASSHALSQERLAGIEFRAAAFTNLTGDHLDYHKTVENYLAAKTRLFQSLSTEATAVLNKQSPQSAHIASKTKTKILWYAIDEPAEITAHIESMDVAGSVCLLDYAGQSERLETALLGRHNISNILAAAGLCLAAGFDLRTTVRGLAALKAVPGRLERIDFKGDFTILIDYAHTDDALKNVLSTLRPLCRGSLIVVFGCGGDRDKSKRPRMAKVAEQLADSVIVTSDNPRTEKPMAIISDMMAGLENPTAETITIEPDRKKAIERALKSAAKNDIILIAGKGHETYQIIGKEKIPFSDKAVAQEWLGKIK